MSLGSLDQQQYRKLLRYESLYGEGSDGHMWFFAFPKDRQDTGEGSLPVRWEPLTALSYSRDLDCDAIPHRSVDARCIPISLVPPHLQGAPPRDAEVHTLQDDLRSEDQDSPGHG